MQSYNKDFDANEEDSWVEVLSETFLVREDGYTNEYVLVLRCGYPVLVIFDGLGKRSGSNAGITLPGHWLIVV